MQRWKSPNILTVKLEFFLCYTCTLHKNVWEYFRARKVVNLSTERISNTHKFLPTHWIFFRHCFIVDGAIVSLSLAFLSLLFRFCFAVFFSFPHVTDGYSLCFMFSMRKFFVLIARFMRICDVQVGAQKSYLITLTRKILQKNEIVLNKNKNISVYYDFRLKSRCRLDVSSIGSEENGFNAMFINLVLR